MATTHSHPRISTGLPNVVETRAIIKQPYRAPNKVNAQNPLHQVLNVFSLSKISPNKAPMRMKKKEAGTK
ncbi:hypothetical protein GCM10007096_22430 [Pullulanibacillus pueri]|uniref:Uncharacterized protein n=1 Tax=Pullulanibacillus pueri TaxID=1437324 RepID=A0A8J2ZWP0_9BACL|nr:hypothetical protein GCM10007096_22430 [Pullulanibacillus pueri]